MRSLALYLTVLWLIVPSFGQSDRATITGTVTEPSGGVLNAASVEARSAETGAQYQARTSSTGNYTLSQLPTGNYELVVTADGFKTHNRKNIFLPVSQTVRVDVILEVGGPTEFVTVTDQASLLKTETGEVSHNVSSVQLNSLPVLPIGPGPGIRNPYALLNLLPGTVFQPDLVVRLNGLPSNTQAFRVDGQDAQSGISWVQSNTQPSVEAMQEVSIKTSNFAAEFGQAGGGLFNVTMKSGTNDLHGSAYNYFRNEFLNAGVPYTSDGHGEHIRNRVRQNDYGFSLGGPVVLPKLYDGHDRTFFFFNWEQFRESRTIRTQAQTVPTEAMRTGDFGAILTGRPVGTDRAGRTLFENQVFDWRSETTTSSGIRVRSPFPGNVIPLAALDPVALKVQSYIPLPTSPSPVSNFVSVFNTSRTSGIPSLKVDQNLTLKAKLSGYWSRTGVFNDNADGLPAPITGSRGTHNVTHTIRLNFDYTWTPTLLLHLGAGLLDSLNLDDVVEFDNATKLGFTGVSAKIFPTILGLASPNFGGLSTRMGPLSQNRLRNSKPTFVASATWVRRNHTMKFGGESVVEGYPNLSNTFAASLMAFSPAQTGTPSAEGVTLPGAVGFSYASFLTGRVNGGNIAAPGQTRLGKHSISGFAQDTWKVTSKLTLDFGLRYDFQTYLRETKGYAPNLGPQTPNPALDGRLGGTIFEGYAPGRCQCDFAKNYPWGFGPRFSAAYQLTGRTVVRGGFGITYTRTAGNNTVSYLLAGNTAYQTSNPSDPAFTMAEGFPYRVTFPNLDPAQYPPSGSLGAFATFADQNSGRPGRVAQWNISVQRELARNFVVEASYIGNRGAWMQSSVMLNDTALQPKELLKVGLDISRPGDLDVLRATLISPTAVQRGFSGKPYSTFPANGLVSQALNPYPQYAAITRIWAPVGSTWYNALQLNATKRLSHGLEFNTNFTWSRQFTIGAEQDSSIGQALSATSVNDVFNYRQNRYLSGSDQPYALVVSGSYVTPRWNRNRWVSEAVRDWQFGVVLRYASGFPMRVPNTNSNLSPYLRRATWANRIPGVPLFFKDLNCNCFDPTTTVVLNPAAWTDPAPGQFSTSAAYYNDYRYQRRPSENFNFGRNFRIREGRMNLYVRAEFTNVFNRLVLNNPALTTFSAVPVRSVAANPSSPYVSGFGVINTLSTNPGSPRSGMLVARLTF